MRWSAIPKIDDNLFSFASSRRTKFRTNDANSYLGRKRQGLWEAKAGGAFKYMMVFDSNPMDGADSLANALNKIKQM